MEATSEAQVHFGLDRSTGRQVAVQGATGRQAPKLTDKIPGTDKASGIDKINPVQNHGFATSLGDLFGPQLRGVHTS
ncbi:hypothetical protein H6758_03115 [Candidatus Nomurabacteria bacterium]|nr:hypothetical protein [Candidatus Nomurabacteria bacterium]